MTMKVNKLNSLQESNSFPSCAAMQNHRSGLAMLQYMKMVVLFLLQCVYLLHVVIFFFPTIPAMPSGG